MVTPESLAKSGTESGHQKAVFCYFASRQKEFPETKWMFAIPNGGFRGDTKESRIIRFSNLIAEGLKPGVSDIFLPYPIAPFCGLYIEMKKPGEKVKKGGKQEEFGNDMIKVGYDWYESDNWENAVEIIKNYLINLTCS
jgi:hypothetical protein